jgi:hypothetical protein
LKVILLIYGILFISYGLFSLPPNESHDFFIHILAVIVEILIGAFIVSAVVEEVIRRDKGTIALVSDGGRAHCITAFI